jgi:hypothetical protein
LQTQDVEQSGWKLGGQLPVERGAARLDQFSHTRRDVLANPGQAAQVGRGEGRDALAAVANDLRGIAVRADLERVVAPNLEQIADLGEDTGDGDVFHGKSG